MFKHFLVLGFRRDNGKQASNAPDVFDSETAALARAKELSENCGTRFTFIVYKAHFKTDLLPEPTVTRAIA